MKPIHSACTGLLMFVLVSANAGAQDVALETEEQKFSYSMGYSIGAQVLQQFAGQDLDIDAEAFSIAIRDAISRSEPALSPEEMQAVVMARREKEMAAQQAASDENMAAGQAYLEENGARDVVTTTDSGLQYEVLTAGEGDSPTAEDTVVVHYRGTLIDGTEFDSSYSRGEPATFQLSGIIPGWQEALQLMKPGGKWNVVIPPDLAYGPRGAGDRIGPNETLIFEIELVEVK